MYVVTQNVHKIAQCTQNCTIHTKFNPSRKKSKSRNGLQHIATHCNTLQPTAIHCNTWHRTATHCNALQHTATRCNILHRTATHCNTLQHTATHCNTLQHTATHFTKNKSRNGVYILHVMRSSKKKLHCKEKTGL